ncbi:hypothetical protein G6O69_13585 [Pseudenhygromyxa sp. WMMC2535]|uniref:alpha/beta hydrolase-fold protein n=1 Tax=Pseudenhygromyxa sp. WMMC2535 TaxID=2712867 RepID=UPI0015566CE9|nr:alpha/beta hydrolase-fold protein [Pseudenhygromyxa sp. WMMC2535]NVB38868.1 hypothetical protein [Pseudenhygromyxa sp. WMMC2535]
MIAKDRLAPTLCLLSCLPLAACAGDDGGASTDESASEETAGGETTGGETGTGETDTGTDTGTEIPELLACKSAPPEGASLAPALPGYGGPGGSCPVLETGDTVNIMDTSAGEREFYLIAPSDYAPGEDLPVMFMYHWLGGDALDFISRAEVQYAADYYGFIAVIPEGRTSEEDVPFRWPFSIADDEQQMEEEYDFHNDMLACVHEQFGADKECVSTMGVSAGAMWSAMLASRHGEHLSSFISLSGGTGGSLVQPWVSTTNHMPAMVLWGGPEDLCLGVDFDANSMEMEAALEVDGHFMVECVHNCTHATPPFEPEDPSWPTYAPAWEFFLDHPYWLEDGESPYTDYVAATGGLPPTWPEWCAVGPGNAEIRQGECGGSEC